MAQLAGLREDFILTQLLAFRTGQRPATITLLYRRGEQVASRSWPGSRPGYASP